MVRALRNNAGFLYVLPALAFVGFFVIWPLIQLVNISFTDTSLLGGGKYVGWDNYIKAFEDKAFWRALWFTVKYTVFITPFLMGLGFALALLTAPNRPLQQITRGIIFIPVVIGIGSSSLLWFWLFDQQVGMFNRILVDIGSHQVEQFLHYTGAKGATVLHSKIANYNQPDHPDFQDFGDAALLADNGATLYVRVDWFTPDGLGAWGDGRTFLLGTDGYLELRKYLDIARDAEGDHVYLVDHKGERHLAAHGRHGFPYFGQLIRDCLARTEKAMSQRHTFLAIELALKAQAQAMRIAGSGSAVRGGRA